MRLSHRGNEPRWAVLQVLICCCQVLIAASSASQVAVDLLHVVVKAETLLLKLVPGILRGHLELLAASVCMEEKPASTQA